MLITRRAAIYPPPAAHPLHPQWLRKHEARIFTRTLCYWDFKRSSASEAANHRQWIYKSQFQYDKKIKRSRASCSRIWMSFFSLAYNIISTGADVVISLLVTWFMMHQLLVRCFIMCIYMCGRMIKCTSQPRLLLFYAVHAAAESAFYFIIIILTPSVKWSTRKLFSQPANKRGIACALLSMWCPPRHVISSPTLHPTNWEGIRNILRQIDAHWRWATVWYE